MNKRKELLSLISTRQKIEKKKKKKKKKREGEKKTLGKSIKPQIRNGIELEKREKENIPLSPQ